MPAWQLNFETGLRAALAANAAVQAATVGNILPGESHEQMALPFIVYTVQYRREPEVSLPGAWLADVAILAWAADYDAAVQLGADCVVALEHDNVSMGGVPVRMFRASGFSGVQQLRGTPGVIDFGALVEFDVQLDP